MVILLHLHLFFLRDCGYYFPFSSVFFLYIEKTRGTPRVRLCPRAFSEYGALKYQDTSISGRSREKGRRKYKRGRYFKNEGRSNGESRESMTRKRLSDYVYRLKTRRGVRCILYFYIHERVSVYVCERVMRRLFEATSDRGLSWPRRSELLHKYISTAGRLTPPVL